MRAVQLDEFDGPLHQRTIPVPEPGMGEALLRVGACAVDQFDLAIRNGRWSHAVLPLIIGHEIAGEVVAVGPGVAGWAPGDRVAASLYLVCGHCRHCRSGRETICENFGGHVGVSIPGGYAEYVALPARNLVAIPDDLSFPEASVIANAIGTPYHALTKQMRLRPGEFFMVTGAGGGVGIHAVQLAAMMGARVMAVDITTDKLDAARARGAEVVVNPEDEDLTAIARSWTGGRGLDGILELVGPATMPAGLAALAKGGRMVVVGSHTGTELTISPHAFYQNEFELLGSRNVSVGELAEVVDLVAAGKVEPVVSGTYPLEQVEELHERVRNRTVIGREVLVP
jgi:propanol-preferring alcohol dehydrogenase